MLEGGNQNAMLGAMKVLETNAASQQNSFYCFRLPIHPMLEGGDPNAMLGVIKFLGVNSAGTSNVVTEMI